MRLLLAFALVSILSLSAAGAQEARDPPYWASISAGEALMRTGPGRNYPAVWRYRRAGLPVRVIEVYPSWRKVQDPDGATGWMLVNLLTASRAAIVTGGEPRPMRKAATPDSDILYQAQPGVVGKISKCNPDWCRFEVDRKVGFIETDHIWGVDPGEIVP